MVKGNFNELRHRRAEVLGLVDEKDKAVGEAKSQALKEDFPAQFPLEEKVLRLGQGVEVQVERAQLSLGELGF